MNRRKFAQLGVLGFVPFALLGCRKGRPTPTLQATRKHRKFGKLMADPQGVIDLPKGFSGVVLQKAGELMSDGYKVPGQPDGMCCHMDEKGNYILLRNHELGTADWCGRRGVPKEYCQPVANKMYKQEALGGVTRVVVAPSKLQHALSGRCKGQEAIISSNMVLSGTLFNCSGGKTRSGWISCEETDSAEHGYAFRTLVDDKEAVDPIKRRVSNWGRLQREGVTIDFRTGITYMSEDHRECCMYRYVPHDSQHIYGPGKLQALQIKGLADSDPGNALQVDTVWKVSWVDIDDPQAANKLCREQGKAKGATRFNRVEGTVWDGTFLWFIASTAGPLGAGQVWRYHPARKEICLFMQVTDRSVLSMPDNITLTPWGDLMVAEDNYNSQGGADYQYLRLLSHDGEVYDFARNPNNDYIGSSQAPGGELSGCCFSPDGRYLFVNIQAPRHITIAISGPWQ